MATQEVAHVLSVSTLAAAFGARRVNARFFEIIVEALEVLASLVFDLLRVVGVVDRSLVAASDVVGVLSVCEQESAPWKTMAGKAHSLVTSDIVKMQGQLDDWRYEFGGKVLTATKQRRRGLYTSKGDYLIPSSKTVWIGKLLEFASSVTC